MRKSTLALVLIVLLAGGAVTFMYLWGRMPAGLARVVGGDQAEIIRQALAFLQDLKFKDFKNAGTYHAPDVQDQVDIPFLIQRMFAVKPEVLEVLDYEVIYAEVDDSGNRARVKTRTKVKALNEGSLKDVEVLFYFSRKDKASPWYMKLEDSLRGQDADPGKKH